MNDFQSFGRPEYAGFWRRFFASLIDIFWQLPILIFVGWLMYGAQVFHAEAMEARPIDVVLQYLIPAVLVIAFWMWRGATPGKMLLGMRIVDANTFQPVSKGRLALRYLGYYISAVVFMLGYLWAAFDKRKQAWHDKIAGTVVIRDHDY
ncbi:MAG TPA: RDD family protein [Burkholderiaceae bacterium]|nr:RDD family protein [Burkholderiaceae bacterium]